MYKIYNINHDKKQKFGLVFLVDAIHIIVKFHSSSHGAVFWLRLPPQKSTVAKPFKILVLPIAVSYCGTIYL